MARMKRSRTRSFERYRHALVPAALLVLLGSSPYQSAAQDEKPAGEQAEPQGEAQNPGQSDVYFADSGRDRTPKITAFPKYPSIARRDRVEGEATVCFTVNAKGQVIRPGIRSSSHKVFERPALAAIRASTFEPLKPGESKSTLKTCRIYRFKLAPIEVEDRDP